MLHFSAESLSFHQADELLLLQEKQKNQSLTLQEKDRLLTLEQKQLTRKIECLQEKKCTRMRQQNIRELIKQRAQLEAEQDKLPPQLLLQTRRKKLLPAISRIKKQLGLELELLITIQTDYKVTGVTELLDCIFVSQPSCVLSVFDRATFDRLPDITLKPEEETVGPEEETVGVIETADMTSDVANGCLYIFTSNCFRMVAVRYARPITPTNLQTRQGVPTGN